MGAAWYYNRARWETWDGFAPFPEVWRAWKTYQRSRALERLNQIRAQAIGQAGDKAGLYLEADVKEALGG